MKTINKNEKKTIITFGDIKIKKQRFYQHKRPISIDNIDVNKMVAYNKNDVKYFISYKDANKIRPLLISLPKMSAFRINYQTCIQ